MIVQGTLKPDEEGQTAKKKPNSVGLLLVPSRLGHLCSRTLASLVGSMLL